MKMNKRVAVIGAGAAGLATIKACLEEGLDVTGYELSDGVGGLWRYREDVTPEDERSIVANCTHMNSSKEVSSYSDFPAPSHFPNFLPHKFVKDYVESYANHFGLMKHIKLRHKVLKVRESKDPNSRRWTVEVQDLDTLTISKGEFDAVAICVGHLNTPLRPCINGLDKFQGEVVHSASYRTCERFKRKRVGIIGIGNSGADIAVDLCGVASEVYLSSRKGAWFFKRSGGRGLPNDLKIISRQMLQTFNYLPKFVMDYMLLKDVNSYFDHSVYCVKPNHGPYDSIPTLNDDLPTKVLIGDVKIKKGVGQVVEDGIIFQGDKTKTELDSIVLATGFIPKLPFLDIALEEFWTTESCNLYKFVFPPDHGDGTLGFIGYIIPFGPLFPVVEMQGRWFAAVTAGRTKLPSPDDMKKDNRAVQEATHQRFTKGERQIWYVDYVPYMDDLASMIGAKPNLLSMLWNDPALWYKCYFGPLATYQYRLEGPHAWSGAREAIMTCYDRVLQPFRA